MDNRIKQQKEIEQFWYIKNLLNYTLSLTTIILFLFLIIFILWNMKDPMYKRTYRISSTIILFSVLLEQIIWTAIECAYAKEDRLVLSILYFLKRIIMDYLVCIFVIIKALPLILMAKFSYYHLRKDIENSKFKDDYFLWRKNNPNQDKFYKSVMILHLIIVVLIFCVLFRFIEGFQHYSFLFNNPFELINIVNDIHYTKFICYTIWSYAFYMLLITIYAIKLFQLLMYPNIDICLLKTELVFYLIPLLGYKGLDVIKLYHLNQIAHINISFIHNGIAFAFIIIQLYLWLYRYKLASQPINLLIVNYYTFMLNSLCFTFFKSYVDCNQHSNTALLTFWAKYYNYQKKFKQNRKLQKQELMIEACQIYEDHFLQEKSKMLQLLMTNSSFIRIPDSLFKEITEAYNNQFNLSTQKLKTVYSGIFQLINEKLKNSYERMKADKKIKKSLKNIISYTEFDDLQDAIDLMFTYNV